MASALPYNALYAFVSAAKHGSFSKAAEELHVTPAAISQQIRQLEDLLDVQLFHRLSRGLRLTDSGEAGLLQLQQGFKSIQLAVDQIKSDDDKAEINIWSSPSFASLWLMPRMHRFREAHPEIDLRIAGSVSLVDSDATAPSLSAETLKANNIDVAIRFGSGNYPGCQVDKLMDVDAITLCSPSLLQNKKAEKLNTPSDLEHHTLLHDESPYEGRPQWRSWLDSAGLNKLKCERNLYFNSVLLALAAAVEGEGVVLTIDKLAQNHIEKNDLVKLFDLEMEVMQAYHIVSLDGQKKNERVEAFKRWLFSEVQR